MPRKSAALPLLLFGLLAALLVGSWVLVQARERAILQTRLDVTAEHGAKRLERYLETHVQRLEQLGAQILLRGELDEESFREASALHQARNPGLQALNWVEPRGTIRWVEPEAGNLPAVGHDLTAHPVAAAAFLRARDHGGVRATPPLELLQGGWGFAAYHRVRRDGETLGLLNAVFRLPELLSNCLADSDDGQFAFLLRQGDHLLGVLGPRRDLQEDLPAAHSTVRIADTDLRLDVVAVPRSVAARATWVDEALLLLALGLAASLAWLVGVARQRREEAEVSGERFRVLVENAPDAIVALDATSGALVDGNGRAIELLGRSGARLVGLAPEQWSPARQPDGRPSGETFAAHLAEARAGGTPEFEWTVRDARGREIPTEVRLVRMPEPGRELVRASLLDITRRQELERELRRSQAHEAMGRLAGGVAHDFNNLLTAILGATELLGERVRGDAEAERLLRGISATCDRAAQLTQQLLAFSRHSALQPRALDPGELVRGLLPILERVVGARWRIETRLEPCAPVLADAGQLELALLNLTVNARDAMPAGGRITIAAEPAGGEVALVVTDEGEGVADELRDRIFEPFFTTKHPDVGTGIGLATVKQVVEQAGGRVEVESRVGEGATFRALFPAHAGAPAACPPPARAERTGAERPQTVLLVEDEPAVREIVELTLASAGYRVLVASCAEAALQLERCLDGPLDLLLTDVVLPGRSGVELAAELRARRPETRVLLVSGYSATELHLDDGPTGATELLAKPFAPSTLLERVRDLLAASAV